MDRIGHGSSRFGLANSRHGRRNNTINTILVIGGTGNTESGIAGASCRNASTGSGDFTDIGLDYARAAQTR
jgi:hypothetical protein